MDKKHYIHSRGGAFGAGTDTSAQDIAAAVDAALSHKDGHLILHFHGGLVNKDTGLALADRLLPQYKDAGHPVFFVWESGFFETLRNNFAELADEPVVKQLLRKVLEHALKRLGSVSEARSIAPAAVDPRKVREAVDRFWAAPSPATVPYRDERPLVSEQQARSSASRIDEARLKLRAAPINLVANAAADALIDAIAALAEVQGRSGKRPGAARCTGRAAGRAAPDPLQLRRRPERGGRARHAGGRHPEPRIFQPARPAGVHRLVQGGCLRRQLPAPRAGALCAGT